MSPLIFIKAKIARGPEHRNYCLIDLRDSNESRDSKNSQDWDLINFGKSRIIQKWENVGDLDYKCMKISAKVVFQNSGIAGAW